MFVCLYLFFLPLAYRVQCSAVQCACAVYFYPYPELLGFLLFILLLPARMLVAHCSLLVVVLQGGEHTQTPVSCALHALRIRYLLF